MLNCSAPAPATAAIVESFRDTIDSKATLCTGLVRANLADALEDVDRDALLGEASQGLATDRGLEAGCRLARRACRGASKGWATVSGIQCLPGRYDRSSWRP